MEGAHFHLIFVMVAKYKETVTFDFFLGEIGFLLFLERPALCKALVRRHKMFFD